MFICNPDKALKDHVLSFLCIISIFSNRKYLFTKLKMEQYIMNSDGLNGLVSQIGCELEGTFIIGDETIGKCCLCFFSVLNNLTTT